MSAFGHHIQTVEIIMALKSEVDLLTAERDRALDRIAAMAAKMEQMRVALQMWVDRHKQNGESQEELMVSYAYALSAAEKALAAAKGEA